jgi:flagellar protein FlaG
MISEIKSEGLMPRPRPQASNQAAPATDAAVGKPPNVGAKGVPKAQVEDLAQGLQQLVQSVQRQLNFSVDKHTGSTVIKVIDSATEEVVRQIPSEEILTLQRRLAEIQEAGHSADASALEGMLFNSKA